MFLVGCCLCFLRSSLAGDPAVDRGRLRPAGEQHAGGPTHLQPGETSFHHRQWHLTACPQVNYKQLQFCSCKCNLDLVLFSCCFLFSEMKSTVRSANSSLRIHQRAATPAGGSCCHSALAALPPQKSLSK